MLTKLPELDGINSQFSTEEKEHWDTAILYFNTHAAFIKNVRNDVGGHFGSEAAIYALQNLLSQALGKVEFALHTPMKMHPLKLHFAHEVALTAYLKHPPGATLEEKMDFLVKTIGEGFPHASRCVEILVSRHLWPRFGK